MNLLDIFINGYKGYANYLWIEISQPSFHNYFYLLTLASIGFLILEIIAPWRRNQKFIRRDFWLDLFYMYFNFFIFSLIIYNAGSDVIVHLLHRVLSAITPVDFSQFNPLSSWPLWAVLLIGFVVRDFIQWWTHRLLHKVSFLWNFHKVHHSVKEMGFAAHLRYHWMETIVYRTIEYLPLAFLGIGLYDFFIIHVFTLLIGHYNHSNISVPEKIIGGVFGSLLCLIIFSQIIQIPIVSNMSLLSSVLYLLTGFLIGYFFLSGKVKYIFNSPEMHIWHHAKDLPSTRKYGVNFGLSLSIWDYLFNTAYIPRNGRDIELGFKDDEKFPTSFLRQLTYGIFIKGKRSPDTNYDV